MDGSSGPAFELERILADDGRVRIAGRWHGVRGRRFIRPSLSAIGGRSRARALADLEHKPWSPEGEEPWLAEFVWEHSLHDVEAFELAVAPDLAVRITLPSSSTRTRKRGTSAASGATKTVRAPQGSRPQTAGRKGGVASVRRPAPPIAASVPNDLRLAGLEQERDRALAARDQAIAERDRLAGELDQSVAERKQLLEERAAAIERVAQRTAELDRAVAESRSLRDESDRAVRERDEALHARKRSDAERDALAAERHALLGERTELLKARDQARAERNGLLEQRAKQQAERDSLAHERHRAYELRDAVAAERDRFRDERDRAVAERNASAGELRRACEERDRYRAAHDRVVAERNKVADELERIRSERQAIEAWDRSSDATPPVRRPRTPRQTAADHANHHAEAFPHLLARAIAVIGLVAIAVIVVLIVLSH